MPARSAVELTLKKSKLELSDEAAPKSSRRADMAPANGYAMVVDGHFKKHFADAKAARKACVELLANYPMLRVEIYDAVTKLRSLVRNVP